jgi:DNA modification methylase
MQLLEKSINEVGVIESISVTKEGTIISGHARKATFDKQGKKPKEVHLSDNEYPVIVRADIEDDTELYYKAQILANTTSKQNIDLDTELIEEIAVEYDLDIEELGVDVVEDTETHLSAEEDDFDTTPPEVPITVLGDLYEIGEHRLLCGDSTDSDQVAKLMNGNKADMVFTDPPYSITTQGGGVLQKHFTKTAERIKDIVDFKPQEWLQTLPLYFNGNMNTFIFCNKDLIPDYLSFAKENNYNFNILVWCKKQVVPFTGGHHYSDIEYIIYLSKKPIFNNGLKGVEYRKYFVLDNEKSKDHPTIKPLEIISNEIQIASNKNGIVAECFTGSGSTMVASHQLKRKCYGMELDPKYCDVIVRRMIKLDPTLVIKRNGEVTNEFNETK